MSDVPTSTKGKTVPAATLTTGNITLYPSEDGNDLLASKKGDMSSYLMHHRPVLFRVRIQWLHSLILHLLNQRSVMETQGLTFPVSAQLPIESGATMTVWVHPATDNTKLTIQVIDHAAPTLAQSYDSDDLEVVAEEPIRLMFTENEMVQLLSMMFDQLSNNGQLVWT